MAKVVLRLTINSISSTPFPANPQIGDMRVFTDDIVQINGQALTPGLYEHSGFCFLVRQPAFWLCQAAYVVPGIKKRHFRKGGQIQARGLFDETATTSSPDFAAITGGHGDYRRATGEVRFLDATHWKLTIFTP
jgi:allene oxide cyclase-like protein